MMDKYILPVPLDRAYRLINHGPTVLISAQHDGIENVMPAAWTCALDFAPPRLTVVIDKATSTRGLVEASSKFVVQIPTAAQVQLTRQLGGSSLATNPCKLADSGVELFRMEGYDTPFVTGCSAWLACNIISEPHVQKTYDLFIADVTAAWADSRVFRDGHWSFEDATPEWRSLHYIAGGHFYAIGEPFRPVEQAL